MENIKTEKVGRKRGRPKLDAYITEGYAPSAGQAGLHRLRLPCQPCYRRRSSRIYHTGGGGCPAGNLHGGEVQHEKSRQRGALLCAGQYRGHSAENGRSRMETENRPVKITVAGELPGFEYGGCRGVF